MNTNYENSSIDVKDKVVSQQTHGTDDITCGGSLENPTHKLSKKIEKSIFPGLSLSNPTEEERDFIYRDEDDNIMVVDKIKGSSQFVWKRVYTLDDLESGGEYLFAYFTEADGNEYGVAFDGSLETLDVDGNVIEVYRYWNPEIGDDIIDYNETNKNSYFIIEQIDVDNYSIRSASGLYIGRTQNSNGMNISDSTPFANTITKAGSIIIITSSAGPRLQKNRSSNRFRYFKSNQGPIYIFKKTEISTPDVYTWKTLVSNDDIDVITEEELDEILVPQCIEGNKMDC